MYINNIRMRLKSLLIGLDYKQVEYRKLNGSQYAKKLQEYIQGKYEDITDDNCLIITDEDKMTSSHDGLLKEFYKLGLESWSNDLDVVFIYYAGDTIDIAEYVNAYSGNYRINQGIVPSDYSLNGIIHKEKLQELLGQFNPQTKIIMITDCCFVHENILDLKYNWYIDDHVEHIYENERYNNVFDENRKVIVVSYKLLKYTTDDDNFYNILKMNENIKSIADYITKLYDVNDDVFDLLRDIIRLHINKNINMIPCISSTYNIHMDHDIFGHYKSTNRSIQRQLMSGKIPQIDFIPIQNSANFENYIDSDVYSDITDKVRESNYNYFCNKVYQNSTQPIQQYIVKPIANNQHITKTVQIIKPVGMAYPFQTVMVSNVAPAKIIYVTTTPSHSQNTNMGRDISECYC